MADPAGPTVSTVPPSERLPLGATEASPQAPTPTGIWERIKHHKVVQWTLAYAAAGYTLLHGVEMVGDGLGWPHLVISITTALVLLGAPVAAILAWYHGARGLRRVSGMELAIFTLLAIIAGSILWSISRTRGEERAAARVGATASQQLTSPPPASPLRAPAAPRTSIAVMPFANLTGDASQEYLGDGMAEEVINMLTKVQGLKVPARTSSFAYKGRNTDIRQIARDLGVGTVLEGSVRAAGKRIRITAQLINAQDGLHIWSETYDEQFTDLFKLQDDLAKAIVQELRLNLNSTERPADIQASPTQDVVAYQLYLQARSNVSGTEESLRESLALLDRALLRDPKFARAFAGRAGLRESILQIGYPLPNGLEDAERDAAQALALDPNLADAHAATGFASALRGNWLKAEESFQAALANDAADPQLRASHSVDVLESAGQLRKARSETIEASRLAPASAFVTLQLSGVNSLLGLDADAVKFADLAIELGASPISIPLPLIYANAARRSGRYAEAGNHAAEGLSPAVLGAGGAEAVKLADAALADPTKKPAARQALASLVRRIGAEHLDANLAKQLIVAFTQIGALDEAYDLANRSLDGFMRSGSVGSAWGALWLPEMGPFRSDARFQMFVTRLRLIDYWKQHGPPDDCELKDGKLTCH